MKKTIEWKTPKYLQPAYWKSYWSTPSKKPKGYCIKLKRKHEYKWKHSTSVTWFDEIWDYYECVGCGKKKLVTKDLK